MALLSVSYAQLQTQVGSTTYLRGQDLHQRKKVLHASVRVQDDGVHRITASTQGSEVDPYQQDIELDLTGPKLSLRGFCSCPVDYNCKHVVAAVLKVAQDAGAANTLKSLSPDAANALIAQAADLRAKASQLEALSTLKTGTHLASDQAQRAAAQWLNQLNGAAPQRMKASTEHHATQDQVVYTLKYSLKAQHPRQIGTLTLGAGLSHPRVSGKGWLKSKPLNAYSDYLLDAHNPQQAEALRLIRHLSPYSTYSHPGPLEGKLGALAFDLVMTQPNVFLTTSGRDELSAPLQLGDPLSLNWSWQCQDATAPDPLWQLDWHTSNASGQTVQALIYPLTPCVYIDPISGRCGSLNVGSLSTARLAALLNAPALPASVIQFQEIGMRELLGDIALPPVLGSVRALKGLPLTAKLVVERIPAMARHALGWCNVTPYFVYREETIDYAMSHTLVWNTQGANVMLPGNEIHSAQSSKGGDKGGGERVMLVRDTTAEAALLDALQSTGLYHHGDTEWVFNPPKSQLSWLVWAGDNYTELRALGFGIEISASMDGFLQQIDDIHIDMGGQAQTDSPDTIAPQNQWFDLSLGVDIGGARQDILPWLPSILDTIAQAPLKPNGEPDYPEWVYLPRSKAGDEYIRLNITPLHPWLAALIDLVGEREKDFAKGGAIRLSRFEALRATAALGEGAVWHGAAPLREMLSQLKGQTALPEVALPTGLNAQLRPYQHQGLNWLQFLRGHGLSGVLADDMGLGKTLQTLAHILVEKQSGRMVAPVLVVAPVSLMGNWAREAQRFTPQLKVQVFHGMDRHSGADTLLDHDIVLTSYALLPREKERWLATAWHMVVLDEAQNIKNANTHAAKVVSELQAGQRLCLSGTPMENHLGELWSLFHFLMPGFLSSNTKFTKLFRTPIEKHGNTERLAQLRNRVTPFMLRRNKSAVAAELPPKVETITQVKLAGKQADLYETIRLATEVKVREALASKGLARSQITVLDALLKLRQVCCDPRLVPLDKAKSITESAKLEQLMDMLPDMLAQGRRILLFSQFTSMLELIEAALKERQLPWVKLTGQSTKRDAIIERFTSGEVPLFLISLKAGGVGLNLPQADTVIHYDPWWNPAVENQATDRAHRIGQQSTVFVYKMVAQGTIEERILALQARKAELANNMYNGAEGRSQPMFTEADVMDLLQPLG